MWVYRRPAAGAGGFCSVTVRRGARALSSLFGELVVMRADGKALVFVTGGCLPGRVLISRRFACFWVVIFFACLWSLIGKCVFPILWGKVSSLKGVSHYG